MTRVHITSLKQGDEVVGWMRTGLALTLVRRADGSLYRQVPRKPQKGRQGDLQRFAGWIVANNTVEQVLTVQVTRVNSIGQYYAQANEQSFTADISYTAFKRLRLLSKFSYEPNPANNTAPANFPDAAFKPYRTLTEVLLK